VTQKSKAVDKGKKAASGFFGPNRQTITGPAQARCIARENSNRQTTQGSALMAVGQKSKSNTPNFSVVRIFLYVVAWYYIQHTKNTHNSLIVKINKKVDIRMMGAR
jgi:hypothetical protein